MQASLNETDVNTTSMVDETQKKHLFMWISGNLALLVPLWLCWPFHTIPDAMSG